MSVSVTVRDRGRYEVFETNHGNRILALNGERYFAWIEGDESEILVHSDSDHRKDRTQREGKFLVVNYEDDPRHRDMPHLLLQDGDRYREYMLPNGLPSESDYQKRIVSTDESVPTEEIRDYD